MDRCVSSDEAKKYAVNYNIEYFETSALQLITIEIAMYQIAQKILNKAETELAQINEKNEVICLRNNQINEIFSPVKKTDEQTQSCCFIL